MLTTIRTQNKTGYFLALLSGLLLWLAWPHTGFTALIFFAWIPLFMAEEKIKSPFGFFFILWATFLIWNIGTTWWIWNSTGAGATGAIIANSLIMVFPFMAYRFTKKRLGLIAGLVAFITYWISYEYLHHNWELSWPWLTLGNVFATKPEWIQWYKYTGTTGGSLWVLIINTLLFHWWKSMQTDSKKGFTHLAIVGFLILPIALGSIFYPKIKDVDSMDVSKSNIVVIQPNVEAYTEKFSTDPAVLTQRMITLSESKIDSNTRLLVWPETAIPSQAWEHEIDVQPVFQPVFAFLQRHPQIQLVTGIDSYKLWGSENPGGFSIRQMRNGENYEAFNTAMGASKDGPLQLYHKSKLVPGVESLPSWLGFMASVFDDFGGISGSLGRAEKAEVFKAKNNPYQPAPVICYESIYSDYTTEYVQAGANVITIITNDGWWGNTAGHHQHMNYARLRAIETGLWIARSANTGISCFIDPQGHVYQPQPWNKQAAIKMDVPVVNNPSFYARHGDWLSKVVAILAILLFLTTLLAKRLWKKL